jgi:PASTA domain
MTSRAAAPARPTARTQSARRAGPSGRLAVGEYVGQPAAEAAQAVRRAGLKPGLDRSFGCQAELLGLVVAQEPTAGEDLARNGMVTLYVAAPGNAPLEENSDTPSLEDVDPVPASDASLQAVVPEAEASQAPLRPRRPRKPGLAERQPQVFDTPPAPVPADRGIAGETEALAADDAPTEAWESETRVEAPAPSDGEEVDAPIPPDGEEYDEGVPDDRGDEEFSHEEFVVHVDDVFAGRSGRGLPAWRRVYPRRRTVEALGGRGVRARLTAHPLLAGSAAGMLAVWAVVGVVVALANHPAPIHTASVPTSGAAAPAIRVPVKVPAPKPEDVRPVRASASAHFDPRAREVLSRPPEVISAKRAAVRVEEASVQVTPSQRPDPPSTPASAPPAPVREQTQGGLFSP